MMRRLLLPPLLGLVVLGCGRTSPVVTFHTLSPLALRTPATRPLALEIMPVQLPELLQRSQIVVMENRGVHRLATTHRWGNTLEKDLQRVLVENLSALLGSPSVVPYPEGGATLRLALDVSQCDGTPGGTLQFRATWRVTRLDTGQRVLLRRTELAEPVGGSRIEDLVSAHDRLLVKLSQEISEALATLP
jgi:uncharacterized lipoprotein YmbA